MKALVWPVATYGYERYILRKNEETRLDAIETKGLRKILWVCSSLSVIAIVCYSGTIFVSEALNNRISYVFTHEICKKIITPCAAISSPAILCHVLMSCIFSDPRTTSACTIDYPQKGCLLVSHDLFVK